MKRRRRKLAPRFVFFLLVLLAIAAALTLLLKTVLSSGDSNNANYSLEFSPSPTLVVGTTGTVKVAGLPEDYNGTIGWSSSDSEVVTIDHDGTMHAKKVGSVIIAAKVNGKSASGTVNVIDMVDVTSITLDQTSATVLSGETLQLKATVTFENNENISPPITWSSSNTSVARVASDGLVSARDVGSASITATVGNQSATCVITVQQNPNSEPVETTEGTQDETEPADAANPQSTGGTATDNNNSSGSNNNTAGTSTSGNSSSKPSVKSISLSQNIAYLDVNGTMALEAAVSPSGTSVSWSSSDTKLATVSPAGVVTAKGSGTVTITAKAGDKSASCTITIQEDAPPPQDTESGTTE